VVTVVTVTRNDLRRLRATWESLKEQDLAAFEWIVVDGASADGTAEWLGALSDPRLTFVSEPDDGLYDAMNHGLALASGELTTFLNAGDSYLRPDVLSRVAQMHKSEGWQWGHGAAVIVDETGRQVRPVTGGYRGRLRYAFGRSVVTHQTVFARTELLRKLGGFDLRFPIAGDVHMTMRLSGVSPPRVWQSLDVAYEEGGVSDESPGRSLADMHRARVDAFEMGPVAEMGDAVWTKAVLAYVHGRRQAKRAARAVLGERSIDWWASR